MDIIPAYRKWIKAYLGFAYRHRVAIVVFSLILEAAGIRCALKIRLDPDLESLLIAKDVMQDNTCALSFHQTMSEALHVFGRAESECLPVLDKDSHYLGSVTKTDLLLFLAGTSRHAEN